MMLKRKRDPAFATSEKVALLDIVERHFNIVESKKTDAVSMRNKTEEWQKIAMEFNAISGIHPRDWTVLKNCWENLKKRAKQEQASRNQQVLGSGGGPLKPPINDPITNKVLELIQATASGLVNCLDSDETQILILDTASLAQCKADESSSESQQEGNESEPMVMNDPVEIVELDWSQYTPSMLKKNKNPVLAKLLSPSRDVEENKDPITPQRACTTSTIPTTAKRTSRWRPVHKGETEFQTLTNEKIKALIKANSHAEEEHNIKMKILHLQEAKEKEILVQETLKTRQEKIKLEILELQLKKLNE